MFKSLEKQIEENIDKVSIKIGLSNLDARLALLEKEMKKMQHEQEEHCHCKDCGAMMDFKWYSGSGSIYTCRCGMVNVKCRVVGKEKSEWVRA